MGDPFRVGRAELGLSYSTGFTRGYSRSAPPGPELFFLSVTDRYIALPTLTVPTLMWEGNFESKSLLRKRIGMKST